ncbi:MAG: neutral ceramidase [Paenibacillus sp.]|nr:neutral ceramidase [Paenibacillus sp.]
MSALLRAAFGKVCITPEEGAPLQGYNPSRHVANPEMDLLDDLFAKAILLDDGHSRNLILSIDCCLTNEVPFMPRPMKGYGEEYRLLSQTFAEGTRADWGTACGIPESSVTVHATHTHSAPFYFSAKYTSRITRLIEHLAAELQPVQVKAVSGTWGISVNRRPKLQHNDALPIDRSVVTLLFESQDGKPLGAIVNGAVHPTRLLNPLNRISSEFVGLAMNKLEEHFGSGFISLFLQGFGGNVGPVDHYRDEQTDTYPVVKQLADRMFNEIIGTLSGLSPINAVPLVSREHILPMPAREQHYLKQIDFRLHGLRLGDVALLSASGEIFNGFTGLIRDHSPFPYTLLSGVANGYCGYLPTAEAWNDGLLGYEVQTSPYAEEASALFAEGAVKLVRELHEGAENA